MSVVAIGNFDGVHRGHQAVLAQARTAADELGVACLALTFHPHPREVLGGKAPPRLTNLARKQALLRANGASDVVVVPFTRDLAAESPETFARDLLCGRLGARAVVVGESFRFGAKRAGDFGTLSTLGGMLGFEAIAATVTGDAKGPFSSTRARDAIAAGDLREAAHVLGRPHALEGIVEEGDRLGRTLGFPTANLSQIAEMLPPHGVYAVRVEIGEAAEAPIAGAMNIGVRPTIAAAPTLRVEAHLLDWSGDLYGRALRVSVIDRIRDEQRFAGPDALRAQIAKDVGRAREILADEPRS